MAIVPANQAFSWIDIVLFGITIISSVVAIYLYMKLCRLKKYSRLSTVLEEAGNRPIGVIVDRAGKQSPFICEQNPRNKGLLNHNNYTLVNPDLAKPSARTKLFGSEMLYYPLPHFFPFGFTESSALVQTAEKIRENDMLNWIPNEISVLALLFNGTATLFDDCKTVIESNLKFGDEIPNGLLTDRVEWDEDEFEDGGEPEEAYEEEEDYAEETEEEDDASEIEE
jgi:hypothetical protein